MHITLFLLICTVNFFPTIYCADTRENIITEEIIKYLVLNEPGTEHPTPVWRNGLSTNNLAAWHYVNKKWNEVCKKYIDKPRDEIIKKYSTSFIIKPCNILFNEDGQFCFLAHSKDPSDKEKYITFGKDSIINVRKQETYHTDIRSSTLTYYDKYQGKKNDYPIFFLNRNSIIILPHEEKLCTINFIEYSSENYILQSLQKTFNTVIQCAFELSAENTFWHHKFKKNGVTFVHDSNTSLTIDLKNEAIALLCENVKKLHKANKYFKDLSIQNNCHCSPKNIDPVCEKKYNEFCNLLEYESATHLKRDILHEFVRGHIWHEIKNSSKTITASVQYWINPYGALYRYTDTDKQEIDNGYSIIKMSNTNTLKELKNLAQKYTTEWHQFRNIPFRYIIENNTQKIIWLPRFFALEKKFIQPNINRFFIKFTQDICDAHYFIISHPKNIYNDNCDQLLLNFLIKDTTDNSYVILHYYTKNYAIIDINDLNNGVDKKKYNSFDQLKIAFDNMFCTKNLSINVMHGSKNDLEKLMEYIVTFNPNTSSLAHNKSTKDNPLTTFVIPNLNKEYLIMHSTEKHYIKPKSLFDKILYGISSLSLKAKNSYTPAIINYMSGCMILYCKAIPEMLQCAVSDPFPDFTIPSLLLMGNIFINVATKRPYLYKLIWPTRVAACALFGLIGKMLIGGLVPSIAFATLPILNLGLHIYEVNKLEKPIKVPLHELYNSLPVRTHRMLKKIVPHLYTANNNAQ